MLDNNTILFHYDIYNTHCFHSCMCSCAERNHRSNKVSTAAADEGRGLLGDISERGGKELVVGLYLPQQEEGESRAAAVGIHRRTSNRTAYVVQSFMSKKLTVSCLCCFFVQGWRLQAAEKRSAAGIACPLGHAMEPAIVTIDMEEELTERSSLKNKEVRFIAVLQADDLKDGPASPETVTRGSSELIVTDSADEGTERPLFCQV